MKQKLSKIGSQALNSRRMQKRNYRRMRIDKSIVLILIRSIRIFNIRVLSIPIESQ